MKKTISLFVALLMVLSTMLLTACSSDKATVESVLEIDSQYSGHRKITVKYPLSAHIDQLADTLVKNNPLAENEKSTFEYVGVVQDGYEFVMNIVFSSHDDYISQVSSLVGREVVSEMSQPSSVLASGTRMKEDFDTADLIGWMISYADADDGVKNIGYDYSVNTVSINGKAFNTTSKVDISEREGKPINSITVETTNLKDGTYDRTITFSVPNKTYVDLAGSIEQYFTTNTSPAAQYCDWTSLGSSWEYKVIFKGLSIEELSEYTAMLLDIDEHSLFYGDRDNSSTPLSEGLVFEEKFNTFSFIGADDESVKLSYKYALPVKTTHGDGSLYDNGRWNTAGAWQDGIYSVDTESDSMNIRIPDGIQYAINGIRMNLDVVGRNEYIRKTEFLYSKTQGMDGMLYAQDFFNSKGVMVETDEDDENLICRVISEGSTQTITDELVKCFGSGNFMAYTVKEPSFALSAKTELTDYVDFSYMLTSTNANRPITYSVRSSCDENIIDLVCDNKDSDKSDENSEVLTVDVKGGQGTVVYNGNIPDTLNIVVYCVIGALMFSATITAIVLMLRKQYRKKVVNEDTAPSVSQQTTTFSIAELTARKDKIDKIYRDEIDKDINEKIEADRIENLSKELKAKEIEKLSKMVYGDPDESHDEENEETEEENV